MPAGISALAPTANGDPFGLESGKAAFTILQKDGLDTNLPLVDESEDETRRRSDPERKARSDPTFDHRRRISRSNDHLARSRLQPNPLRRESRSRSQDSCRSVPAIKPSMTLSTEDFTEVLNAKLKKLEEQEREREEERKGARKGEGFRRKPFITTVKTGEFLMPPPEVAALLGIASNDEDTDNCPLRSKFKSLASLARKPEVRHSSHIARCPTALKATVDFTLGMMNATTMAAASTTLDDRTSKIAKRNEAT